MRISRELEIVLTLALNEARGWRHAFFSIEHLLHALLHDRVIHAAETNR